MIGNLGAEIWNLGFGTCDQGFGIKDLGLGIWDLDSSSPTDPFNQLDVAQLSKGVVHKRVDFSTFSELNEIC